MFIITFLIFIFILKTVYEEEKKVIVFMYLRSKVRLRQTVGKHGT